ncbi:hypothetical protein ID875_00530 [Streptomyces globisporus]|uniref:Uncharacterized protein n=1 Tax=Streptomyces globisporus TaxID=1908 RepID=A0A927BHL0_STRGL|nr:hypothetical protein [Streptomyces globisporus]
MKLEVCWSDAAGNPTQPQLDNRPAPAVQDPLDEVSLAQHTANVSRRVTEGSLMSSGFDTDAHILHDAPGGVAGRRRRSCPSRCRTSWTRWPARRACTPGTGRRRRRCARPPSDWYGRCALSSDPRPNRTSPRTRGCSGASAPWRPCAPTTRR